MDPIKAITDITGHVLIRIGNAILGNNASDEPRQEVHYHFHLEPGQADNLDKPENKARPWTKRGRQ